MEVYSEHLAKLFAAENIKIELKTTQTAYFDVVKRKMVFPNWILYLPSASRELLMLHEASHALHTPEFGTHEKAKEYETVFRTILNILEDKRIEDAMKEKFPGSRSTFIRGFYELINTGFFGISFNEDTENLSLIDRMNLHFKGDYYFDCEFTEEEQYWVDRAANNKTFDDVYQNSVELLDYLKNQYSKEVLEEIKINLNDIQWGEIENGEGDMEIPLSKLQELLSEEDYEKLKEAIEEKNDEKAGEIIRNAIDQDGGNLDFEEKNVGATDQNWEKSQENFSKGEISNTDYNDQIITNLGFSPYLNYEDFIVDSNICHKILTEDFHSCSDTIHEKFHLFVQEHKKEHAPIISHMVREFYRKKAAEDFRRTKQSKTGNLDLQKLPHFRYDSDLFLNKSVTYDEKNHGFVLLLDWSGSMGSIMTNAMLQLINNVMFCKAISVPFIAYAFSNDAVDNHEHRLSSVVHGVNENDFRVNPNTKLLEIIDSTKSNYDEQLRNLFYLAFTFLPSMISKNRKEHLYYLKNIEKEKKKAENTGETISSYLEAIQEQFDNFVILSEFFDLGSTPLDESLILMNYILPEKQKYMNVDVMNLIVITDGDSNSLPNVANDDSPETTKSFSISDAELSESSDVTEEDLWNKLYAHGKRHNVTPAEHRENMKKFERNSGQGTSIRGHQKIFVRSSRSNRMVEFVSRRNNFTRGVHMNHNREFTRRLAYLIKRETKSNIISIELAITNSQNIRRNFSYEFGNGYSLEEVEEFATQYRKQGFASIDDNGYDKIFYVDLSKLGNSKFNMDYHYFDDFEEMIQTEDDDFFDNVQKTTKGNFTTKSLATALEKNSSVKNRKKFLASRVVDAISEYQAEKKKKEKIVLDFVA
jgi:hypothetical protein